MNSVQEANRSSPKAWLERELQRIRQESVVATRNGNFRKVAELTRAAAKLNEEIKAGGSDF